MSSGAKGSLVLLGRVFGAAASRNAAARAGDAATADVVAGIGNVSSSVFALSGRRSHATSSWSKLFKPAQAFFGGGGSSSSSSSSSSSVGAAGATPAAAAAATSPPPQQQFGFAASAAAASAARAPARSASSSSRSSGGSGSSKPKQQQQRAPRAPTAYALFLKEQLSAKSGGGGKDLSFAERSAAVAAAWKSLPASSRERFEAASRAAKAALPPSPPKPKRGPLSGYQLFVRERLPGLKGGGDAPAASAMKRVAEAWRSAPASVKAEFASRAKSTG